MANLKFPYEGGGYLTVCVDDVYEVADSTPNMVLKTNIPTTAGNVVGITLKYKAPGSFNSADQDNLMAAILEAAQTPGSCETYTLVGDDGTSDNYYLAVADGLTVGSVSI